MKKRALAAVLWALTGWYIGAAFAWLLDLGPLLAPILAVTAAVLVAGDPRKIFWTVPTERN